MSQTILVHSDDDIRKIFSLNLTTYTGTDVVDRFSANEVIELLKILPSISLIVCLDKVNEEKTAYQIHHFLKERKLDIPMIVLGEDDSLIGEVLQLQNPISWELLVKHAGELLGVKEEVTQTKVAPKYIPISLTYFFDIDHTPCEVYIRIKKNVSEYQFVKRLNAQDSFTYEDIEKYMKQGLKDLWIPKDYQQYFVTFVTNSIIARLEDELDLPSRLQTNANAYEIVREHIQKIGLSPEISELAENNIQSMIASLKSAPKIASLLKFLFSSKISYAYQKAHIVCVIGNFIMSKQSWYKARHLETFTYLSFFADITLKTAKQMKINSLEELEGAGLTPEEKEAVLNHAKDAVELIKAFNNTNEYLELVITQHQGSETGVGFPEEPNENIHPIAKVFVISDAFVKIMLDVNTPKSKKEIITILYHQFPQENYQKIIKVLEQKIE